jgi:NADPH:quinone reductase-like Zn-dependent oxidoreductase
MSTTMTAVIHRRYGGPDTLEYVERPRPVPDRGQVLVRQSASSINALDYRVMRADPFLVRFHSGLARPRNRRLGVDVAGTVEAVGSGVTRFRPGDAVLGECSPDGMGAFAQLVCVREQGLVHKPDNVSFEDAAALPLAGITALQALRDKARVRPNESVLVHGAGGGVGTYAVQIAKLLGARVTAVCGPRNVGLMRSFDVAEIIDYTTTDFAEQGRRHDVILGVNGHRKLAEYGRHLNPGGRYVMIGGSSRQLFEAILLGRPRFLFSNRSARFLTIDAGRRGDDLAQLSAWIAEGKIESVIDRRFDLRETADAMRYVEGGHVRGKVVLEAA